MEKSFRNRGKTGSSTLLFFIALLTLSVGCKDNTPGSYTSIKGAWNCHEISFKRNMTYQVDIYKSKSGTTNYLISNFHNDGYENIFVTAELNGNKLTITNQSLNQPGLIVKSGTGIINADFTEIQLSYIVFDGISDLQVNAVYYR